MAQKQYTKAERLLMIQHGVDPWNGNYLQIKNRPNEIEYKDFDPETSFDDPHMIKMWGKDGCEKLKKFYKTIDKARIRNQKFNASWSTISPEYVQQKISILSKKEK